MTRWASWKGFFFLGMDRNAMEWHQDNAQDKLHERCCDRKCEFASASITEAARRLSSHHSAVSKFQYIVRSGERMGKWVRSVAGRGSVNNGEMMPSEKSGSLW
jgi:hypothetical protein